LVLIGPVDRALTRRLQIDDADIDLIGAISRSEVVRWMQSSSVFALASVTEGLALVTVQAMACGLPVVASEATGIADIVTDGVHGFVVPTGDEDALADALDQLLRDPELARAMGAAARLRVLELGGWNTYGDTASAAFEDLLVT
jgi:glycosyltransferase involved in cell wall biosynthesis